MSFQLTYRDLANNNFISAMRKLCASDKFKDIKRAYNIGRVGTLLEGELKTFNELRRKMALKFRDHQPENNDQPTEEDLKAIEAMKAETEKFLEIGFTLERHKVHFGDLEGLELSPNEICALAPLIEGDPDSWEEGKVIEPGAAKPDIQIVKDFPAK